MTVAPDASSAQSVLLRDAVLSDLDALHALELRCFDSDRISRRSFRRFLDADRDILLVAENEQGLAGYLLILLRRGTRLGRIYSVCVNPDCRGQRIAESLMSAGEQQARERGCAYLRLEVKDTNQGAIALYRKLGYRKFGVISHYYEDAHDALRFEKRIRHFDSQHAAIEIPYYAQSTRFTCGPACLMMAMRALDPDTNMSQREELRIWRESTTIFMTSGHGGCGPHGLALAALTRGFRPELWLNREDVLFADGMRNSAKQEIVAVVQADFESQLAEHQIKPRIGELALGDLSQLLRARRIPIMLISSWALTREKAPHWIVVAGVDDEFVYIHDPDVEHDDTETVLDCHFMPIDHATFKRMTRFGKAGLRATVVISR